jgi:GMP synthase (glutamine-hydrolysing)
MKNAVAIRHVAFEDAGTLQPVFKDRGIDLRYLEAGVDDLSPAKDADLLVVLGGPIGIYEVDRYPFLKQELATIETAVKKGVP